MSGPPSWCSPSEVPGSGLRAVILGPPGSGKGTQAARVAAHFGVAHIASGDLFRHHVTTGTPVGLAIRGYLARGDLVPDEIVLAMLQEAAVSAARSGGYVLDGFPRTLAQAEAADETGRRHGCVPRLALALEVHADELVRRLLHRAQDQGRNDDTDQTIRHRLEVFEEQTRPVLRHYERWGVLVRIDGARPPAEVTASVLGVLQAVARA